MIDKESVFVGFGLRFLLVYGVFGDQTIMRLGRRKWTLGAQAYFILLTLKVSKLCQVEYWPGSGARQMPKFLQTKFTSRGGSAAKGIE